MPVRHTDFAFVKDTFDASEYPDELKPTPGSDRFPFTVPKTRIEGTTLSKPAQLLRERIAEVMRCDADDVPLGLLRAVEAADAWPDENVKNLASGRVRTISTEAGEVCYVEFFANPLALTHDPNNGRTTADARAKKLPYLEAVADDPTTGAPIISVGSAADFIRGVEETCTALGFTRTISDSKDLADINWIGLQGVHEPALTTPTLVRDEDGGSTWILKQDDGNRRLAMLRRVLREATGLGSSDVEAWADHLYQADGTTALRDWTAEDVAAVRRKSGFKDTRYWRPAAATDEAVAEWLTTATIAQRTVIRASVVPVRLVVGYRNLTGSGGDRSASLEAVHRYIRRTHIKTAAQRDWSPGTQAMQVALDSLRRIMARSQVTHGYQMALAPNELTAVYLNTVPDWQAVDVDDPCHPLRLAAKAIATFVCTGTTAENDVKASLIAHAMSTHATKIRENRATVAASVAMPILGITVEVNKGDYNRARAAVDRASRHPMFAAVTRHPASTNPWWAYLDKPVDELQALALAEFDAGNGTTDSPDDKSVGNFGPATRALLFLATVGQATNPAFVTPAPGEPAAPWQLTLNGLGGTRGTTLTTPDLVMRQVLAVHGADGATQLAAMVRAALAADLPINTLEPDYVDIDHHGNPDERTRGTVTERFLRGPFMGWGATEDEPADGPSGGPSSGPDDEPVPPGPRRDEFDQALDHLRNAVAVAAASTVVFTDEGSDVAKAFKETGMPAAYTKALLKQAQRIVRVLQQGEFIAASRSGGLGFDDDEDEA
jgi:hypothetical protein